MEVQVRKRPTKEEIELLPPFQGLSLDRITVLKTVEEFAAARSAIAEERFIGFDTESKAIFLKDAVQGGPHVIQFALRDRAFIVQVGSEHSLDFLKPVLESNEIIKVGFGLKSDRAQLFNKLGIRLGATVELTQVLRTLRYKEALGVKAAVAIVLGQKLRKSKSVTTSNWANPELTPNQLLYAANDAYAALAVFRAMGEPIAPDDIATA